MMLRSESQNRRTPCLAKPRPRPSRLGIGVLFLLLVVACDPGPSSNGGDTATIGEESDSTHLETAVSESIPIPRPKRIILISLDTVGSRHVSGYSKALTPSLQKLAQDGVRFDDFYAASTYTLPSQMSMMTGLDPIEHGVVNYNARLAPEVPTLASKLAAAGYDTKAFTESGFIDRIYGFDQGFRDFQERSHGQVPKTSIWEILDWMKEKGDAPYFLFLHTYVAHTPYGGFADFRNRHPELDLPDDREIAALKTRYNVLDRKKNASSPRVIPPGLRHVCTFYNLTSESNIDLLGCGPQRIKEDFLEDPHFETYRNGILQAYQAAIRRGDRMVGQIREALIELGQLEDTLLIITSDHGEAMFEHSVHGHEYTPFNEVIEVPLFLAYPRRIEGPQVVNGLTWHLDLFPTILSLAGIDFDANPWGMDLSGVMAKQEEVPEDRAIFPLLLRPTTHTHLPRRRMALRRAFKFIDGSDRYGDPTGLLFDLETSPGEDENLRRTKPEMFAEYRELADDYDASLTPGEPIDQDTRERISPFPGEVDPYEMPEDVRRGLAELGYIESDEMLDGDGR